MQKKVDFLVIGAGIIGLSLAKELKLKYGSSSVLVVEKEFGVAEHASGRNSGVLHAGFYYSGESLKAKFCLQGNEELRSLIIRNKLPLRETGKVVVAKNAEELERLEKLFSRGRENGVRLELFEESKLLEYEPLAKTYKKFIWSPNTATGSPLLVSETLLSDFMKLGGEIEFNSTFNVIKGDYFINDVQVEAGRIINAAGTGALAIAHKFNLGIEYAQLPVLGTYRYTSHTNLGLRRLVYPVPNPKNPFLGVHFTVTVDGEIKIGPSAIPTVSNEFYKLGDEISLRDTFSAFKSIQKMAFKSWPIFSQLVTKELPKIKVNNLLNEGKKIVPSSINVKSWQKLKPGIRAQLVQLNSGNFEMDFQIRDSKDSVHILNAVSPGWTAALPFSKWIIDNYID